MIKAIFRDFDGTIGDTIELMFQSANNLAKRHHWKNIPDKKYFAQKV